MSPHEIRNYMTPDPVTIRARANILDAASLMREQGVRHLPVVDSSDRLVGILSDRDIAAAWNRRPLRFPLVEEAMTPRPFTVTPTTELRDALERMAGEKISSVVVTDTGARVLGIFTTVDVVRTLLARVSR